MPGHRKLGRTTTQRKAMLRNLATNLLYHGRIKTTETRAKEVRKVAEKLITLAVKEKDNYTEVTKTFKVPQKNAKGQRMKEDVNGKRVTVYDTIERTVKVDSPTRLNARRKILSVLYPVTEVPADGRKKRSLSKQINMADKLFDEIATRYVDRPGGYTRIIKIGKRKGDAAEEVYIELV
ncbi:MAG: 50S ribosomal protein L17 [Defluviitaleaceae bacterium]|nr:50S ribosomal protein L17 [Defluviitaleaceae bacterium]